MASYKFVVLTNPTAGREGEFNKWYSERHLPDVLDVPGMASAQRFRLVENEMSRDTAHKYLAIYDIETDDLAATMKEVMARAGTDRMPLSEALSSDSKTFIFEVMSPVVKSKRKS